MCLAVPAQLIKRDSDTAVADLHGNRVEISLALVPEAQLGDWVLVHAGFAIQKLQGDDLSETWAVLEDLRSAEEGAS
ncbi:MAG TPA: HypC/HybG/HupF family hydrogenase formation chaperone [Tepidisphaeraceae bacterium]|nr:HypC/HybG/HupF family hydrogenase formation chaperone [Tepidisphaeraceae bacterium]